MQFVLDLMLLVLRVMLAQLHGRVLLGTPLALLCHVLPIQVVSLTALVILDGLVDFCHGMAATMVLAHMWHALPTVIVWHQVNAIAKTISVGLSHGKATHTAATALFLRALITEGAPQAASVFAHSKLLWILVGHRQHALGKVNALQLLVPRIQWRRSKTAHAQQGIQERLCGIQSQLTFLAFVFSNRAHLLRQEKDAFVSQVSQAFLLGMVCNGNTFALLVDALQTPYK
jgi:hypothetical protein